VTRRPAGRFRGVAAVVASIAAALILTVSVFSVGARPAGAAPRQVTASIEVVDQTTWVHRGERFDVDLRVTGAPAGAAVRLVVHDRLESRSEFRDTLDGDLGGVEEALPAEPVATSGAGARTFSTGFVVGGDGQRLEGRGVYPVEVQLVDAGDNLLAAPVATYLMYLFSPDGPSFAPLAFAVVVDVGGPPILQADGTFRPTATTVDRAQERANLLAAAGDVPVTLAPQPETLDGLVAAGGAAGAAVTSLVESSGDRPVLARPYTDVDLEALQDSGLASEADEQVDAGAATLRKLFGRAPVPGIWLSGPTLGDDAMDDAVDLGMDRAVVPPSAVEGGDVPAAPVTLDDGGPRVMVSDSELATHLRGDDGAVDAQRFLAELTITWFERPADPRAVVVRIPDDTDIVPSTVARALNGLTDGQAVQAVPLDQVFDVPPDASGPSTISLARHEVTDDLTGIAAPLRRARRGVSGVAGTVASDGGSLTGSLLVATGTATPDVQRPAYVERVNAALGSLSGAVTLPDQFRITLTSRTSTIPVNITNNSDQPLKVRIEFDSGQLEFLDGDIVTRELPPGVTRLDVRVRALTSGAFPMGITVRSPDSSIELDRTTFDIRSTAVTGVGLVLSIGAVLFLAVWWARNWRSSRRSRHLVPAGAAGAPPGRPGEGLAQSGAAIDGSEPADDPGGYRPAHLAGGRSRRA
jgi:Family of unknown function (DUF6049)